MKRFLPWLGVIAACNGTPQVNVTLLSIADELNPEVDLEFTIEGVQTAFLRIEKEPIPVTEPILLPEGFSDAPLKITARAFIGERQVAIGTVDVSPGEEDVTIRFAVCANGAVEAEELCDDANVIDGDGCDSTCRPTGCGSGVFTQGEVCFQQGPSIVANAVASKTTVQDFDGDGRLDIIASYPTDGKARIFFGSEDNQFGNFVEVDTVADSSLVAAADLDNDGAQDFVAANATLIRVFSNEGDSFPLAQGLLVDATVGDLALADINGDGVPEQIRTEFSQVIATNRVTVLEGIGDGTFAEISLNTNTGAQPTQLAIVDIDQDGDVDVLSLNLSGSVSVLINNAGILTQEVQIPTNGTLIALSSADFDGDGFPDVAVTKQAGTGFISIFRQSNNQPIEFIGAGDFAAPNNTKGLIATDVDLDGDEDIVVASENDSTTTVFLNNGQAQFSSIPPVTTTQNPTHLAAGDLNQDGLLDFISAGQDVGLILSNP